LCGFKLEYLKKKINVTDEKHGTSDELLHPDGQKDRDMTKLSGAFCVFQTLLPYLDLPDSTMYNKVESNGFRASVFSHHSEKKETEKMCLSGRIGTFT
jgi:hypothetical protein